MALGRLSRALFWATVFLASKSAAVPSSELVPRQTCNTPTNRQCWTTQFNINTDYEQSWPNTGVVQRYTWTITEVDNWVGGDGVTKSHAMLVNGQYPGPAITANWGDIIEVTVINRLQYNGTGIHWHGLRQLNNNIRDGVPGVTECPIPPNGNQKTYRFQATQYGSSWYHSHFSIQYANGLAGPIVINGPASANYDVDLGPLMVGDWHYGSADQIRLRVDNPNNPFIPGFPGSPPPSDNVLFNGRNINPRGAGGSYQRITLTPGLKHRLRIINPSVENTYTVSLVGHSMQIIATDFVPVAPVTVNTLYVSVGQRYDVIITANQAVGNYWFNATLPPGPCGLSNNPRPAAIFSYTGATGNPTSPGTAPPDPRCDDPNNFAPVVTRSAPVAQFTPGTGNSLETHIETRRGGVNRVYWPVNNSPIRVDWGMPTLKYVQQGTTAQMPAQENVVYVPQPNTTTFWLIINNSSIPHPMHLHGHDILIHGHAPALANPLAPVNRLRNYNPATDGPTLQGNNPTRRDTTVLPAWGWLVISYVTNNPGAWLFHCHTAWHVSQGLSIQYLEQLTAIPQRMDLNDLTANCNNWNAYYPTAPYRQDDSGV